MKKLNIKKAKNQILGLLVAALIIIGSIMLGAISTATDGVEQKIDTSKISGTVEFTLSKYVNYNVENQKGAIVELNAKNGLKFEEGEPEVALKATGIIINVSKINNELPKTVEVVDGKLVNYDPNSGIIKISTDKENFKVILDYGENSYIEKANSMQNKETEKPKIELKGILYSQLNAEEETIIKSNYQSSVELEEKSGLISSKVSTTSIYNGFIKNKKTTEYQENYDINISKKELGDETTFEVTNNFGRDKVTYISSLVEKNNILNILGDTGSLTVLDEAGNTIAKIDRDTKVDEKGLCKIDYPQNVSKLLIKITKPKTVGKIRMQSVKQIPAEVEDKAINNLETASTIKIINKKEVKEQVLNKETNKTETKTKIEETEIYKYQEKAQVAVGESRTQVNLKIENDKYTWTNERQNELEFTLELPISSNKYNLFKNPSIEIKLPEEVNKVVIDEDILKKAKVMYANGLELKAIDYNTETKTIKVELTGEQKDYINENIAKGTTITFPAIVILNQEIESKDCDINVSYSNYLAFENDALEEGNSVTKVKVENFKEATQQLTANKSLLKNATAVNNTESLIDTSAQEAPYKVTLTQKSSEVEEYFHYYVDVEGELEQNAKVEIELPDCVDVDYYYYNGNYHTIDQNSSSKIEIDIIKEENTSKYTYNLTAKINTNKVYSNLEYKNKGEIELRAQAILDVGEDKYYSNESIFKYEKKCITVSMSSENEGKEINIGDEIKYTIEVANKGKSETTEDGLSYSTVLLSMITPEKLEKIKLHYKYWTIEKDENENAYWSNENQRNSEKISDAVYDKNNEKIANINEYLTIPAGETVQIEVSGVAGYVLKDTEIVAIAELSDPKGMIQLNDGNSETEGETIEYSNISKYNSSNEVKHKILAYTEQEAIDENPGKKPGEEIPVDGDTNQKGSISGFAWLDKNEDGQRQDNEEKLSKIEAFLIDSNYNVLGKTYTDENGYYSFDNLVINNYIIVFKYDANKYSITKYKQINIDENVNSDFLKSIKKIENEEITCGITDLLTVQTNLQNIDIGLTENKKFDFKVDNYISKVSVETENGTNDKTFNNSKLAKIEINSKEIEGSEVTVEYKIIVTNAGEIAGKIGKIVDYIPNGFKLSLKNNSNWINNEDGTISNTSLKGTIIEPNESIELTLVLTKKMTEDTVGTFNNKVIIDEIINDLNINEESMDNNNSKSELIISIGTGRALYVSIILILVVGLLVFLNYKFKIFKTVKFKMFGILIVSGIIAIGFSDIGVKATVWYDIKVNEESYRRYALTSRYNAGNYSAGDIISQYRWRAESSRKDRILSNCKIYALNYNGIYSVQELGFDIKMSDTLTIDGNKLTIGSHTITIANELIRQNIQTYWGNTAFNGSPMIENPLVTCHFLFIERDWKAAVDVNKSYSVAGNNVYKGMAICIDQDAEFGGGTYLDDRAEAFPRMSDNEAVYEYGSENPVNMYYAKDYKLNTILTSENISNSSFNRDLEEYYRKYGYSDGSSYTISINNGVGIALDYNSEPGTLIIGPVSLTSTNPNALVNTNTGMNLNGEWNFPMFKKQNGSFIKISDSDDAIKVNDCKDVFFRVSTGYLHSYNVLKINAYLPDNNSSIDGNTGWKSLGTINVYWEPIGGGQPLMSTEEAEYCIYGSKNSEVTSDWRDFDYSPEPPPDIHPPEASLQLTKVDSRTNEKLEGVRFKILDVNENLWVKVEKEDKDNCKFFGLIDECIVNTIPAKINGEYKYAENFETDSSGKTVKINGLNCEHKYKIYEIHAGKNAAMYELGTFSYGGVNQSGKELKQSDYNYNYNCSISNNGEITLNPDSSAGVTIQNVRAGINLEIKKVDEDNQGRVDGIEFKIYSFDPSNKNSGWVKTKKDGSDTVFDEIVDYNESSTFKTNKYGNTGSIQGLPKALYRVYEISAGKYEEYYDLGTFKEPIDSNNPIKGKRVDDNSIGYLKTYYSSVPYYDFSKAKSDTFITVTAKNKANTASLKIHKTDKTSGKNLDGIKFKVYDVTKGGWIKVRKNGDKYIYDSITTVYNSKDNDSTFSTDSKGNTVTIGGLPVDHTYKIFEVGLGDYTDYYTLGDDLKDVGVTSNYSGTLLKYGENGGNATVKNASSSNIKGELKLKTGTTVTVEATNIATAKLQIVKIDEKTEALLEGIKFKIWYSGDTNNNKGWIQVKKVKKNGMNVYEFDSTNSNNFSKVTKTAEDWEEGKTYDAFVTGEDGKTIKIEKLPIGTYTIYEVDLGDYKSVYSLGNDIENYFSSYTWASGKQGTRIGENVDFTINKNFGDEPTFYNKSLTIKNGCDITLTVKNKSTKSSLEIVKEDQTGTRYAGVRFKIWCCGDSNGNGEKGWVSAKYKSADDVFEYKSITTNYNNNIVPVKFQINPNDTYTTFVTYNDQGTTAYTVNGGKTIPIIGLPSEYKYLIFELEDGNPFKDICKFNKIIPQGGIDINAIQLDKDNTTGGTVDDNNRFSFDGGGTIKLTMTNNAHGNIKIVKQNTGGDKLSGFKFKIFDDEAKQWIQYRYDGEQFTVLDPDGNVMRTSEYKVEEDIPAPSKDIWKNLTLAKFSTLQTYEAEGLNTNGKGSTITLTGLPIGPKHHYKIYEVEMPENFASLYDLTEQTVTTTDGETAFNAIPLNNSNAKGNNNITFDTYNRISPTVKNETTITLTMTNKEKNSITIKKQDKATGEALQGIKFKLLDVRTNEWVQVQYDGNFYNYAKTTNKYNLDVPNGKWKQGDTYSTFVTNQNGELITIKGLPTEDKFYRLYEVDLPEKYAGKYKLGKFSYTNGPNSGEKQGNIVELDAGKSNGITVSNNGLFTISDEANIVITAVNEQKGYQISGKVGLMEKSGKDKQEYHGTIDKLLEGIKVILKLNGVEQSNTYTNALGEYSFDNLDEENMKNYSIEFSYDGYTYQAIESDKSISNPPAENTSKAEEDKIRRDALNQNGLGITSHDKNIDSQLTATISEDIIGGHFDLIKDKNIYSIDNMNLCLYKRDMPNLALSKDITKATVQVNGEKFTYDLEKTLGSKVEIQQAKDETLLGIRVEDFINGINDATNYEAPIFNADVEYSNDPNTPKDDKLKVTLEYKIALSNNSVLYTTVNELNEFFTTNMQWENEAVYDSEGKEIPVKYFDQIVGENIKNENIKGYNYYRIVFENGIKIAPNQTRTISIRFTLPEEQLKNKRLYDDTQFRNYAEIGKYSVYSDINETPYWGYDENSEPNNFISGLYEDDDDRAPGIKILEAGNRYISGTAFEDGVLTIENHKSIGDSIYNDQTENRLSNVKVQLIDKNGNVANGYDENGKIWPCETTTNRQGYYEFAFIPAGQYKVRFIWGEGEGTQIVEEDGTTQNVSINKYEATTWSEDNLKEKQDEKWYLNKQQRYSDAQDENRNLNTVEANTQLIKLSPSYLVTDEYERDIKGGFSRYKLIINYIDFGIIKKPIPIVEIDKRVKHINISSGTLVLVNADINEAATGFKNAKDVLFATYMPASPQDPFGTIKAEIDGLYPLNIEVTYEITLSYENLTKEDKQNIKIYDYLDGKYGGIKEKAGYKPLSAKEYKDTTTATATESGYENYWKDKSTTFGYGIDKIYNDWKTILGTSSEVQEAKISNRNIYELTNLEKQLGGDKEDGQISYSFTATSIIANDSESINFLNDVEVVGIDESDDNPIENLYDRAEEVIITPPTGENKNLGETIIIAISSLVIVTGALVGKKYLRKKSL